MKNFTFTVGHGKNKTGGYDPGACAFGKEEYQLARMITLVAANTLRSKYICNVNVLNANKDMYLQDRINKFLKKDSTDLLVEIHMNAFQNNTAHGTEVWHYPGDALGTKFATAIANELASKLGVTLRGAKATNRNQFGIIDRTAPTALLVETTFITNKADMEKVTRDNGVAAGVAIAEAIARTAGLTPIKAPTPIISAPIKVPPVYSAPVVDYTKLLAEKDATIASLKAKINAAVNALK